LWWANRLQLVVKVQSYSISAQHWILETPVSNNQATCAWYRDRTLQRYDVRPILRKKKMRWRAQVASQAYGVNEEEGSLARLATRAIEDSRHIALRMLIREDPIKLS
jgi:hypothetical protein